MTAATRRAAIYARVSTADQTTENQLLRLREVAARAGWEIVQTFTETASGASRSRPALDAMMAQAARRRFAARLTDWQAKTYGWNRVRRGMSGACPVDCRACPFGSSSVKGVAKLLHEDAGDAHPTYQAAVRT